jgi:hypothetical protein
VDGDERVGAGGGRDQPIMEVTAGLHVQADIDDDAENYQEQG